MVDNETFLFLSLDGGLVLVYLVLQFIQFVLSEIPQPFLVFLSLLWIFFHQGFGDVGSDDISTFDAHPGVWIYISALRFEHSDTCGCVYHFHVGCILLEFLHPSFFKSYLSYFKIESAL